MKFPITQYFIEYPIEKGEMWVFWILDGLLYIGVVCILVAIFLATEELVSIKNWFSWSGVIVDKLYKPSSSSTGTGIGMVGGQAAVVATSNHSPEEWFVMVRLDETKRIEKIYCSDDFFYNHNVGDKIDFEYKMSRIRPKAILSKYKAIEE